jgi:phage gp45-like
MDDNISEIIKRIDRIEQTINSKLDPLVDILQTVISNSLKKTNINSTEDTNSHAPPDLMYVSDSENVYISGNKTYDNREIIKATFKGSSWNKERSAWTFKKFEDYEKTLTNIFPNIIKGQ